MTWRQVTSEKVLKKSVTHSLGAYIGSSQETVAEWVALRPILELCNRETGYKVGVGHQEPWWRKTTSRKHLSAVLKEIFAAAR